MLNKDKDISNWKIPSHIGKESSWEAIQSKINAKDSAKVIPLFKRNSTWISMAASFALIFGLVFFINQNGVQSFQTAYGEKETITLPDGSIAYLNSGSSLEYNSSDWENKRVIKLEGEAFFEVKKGETFSVKSSNGLVQVLGTSFNIINRNSLYQVSCKTGKVRVSNNIGEQVLTPGLRTELVDNKISAPEPCDLNQIDSWVEGGVYHFENMPLVEAFNELERQHDISIDASSISSDLMINADIDLGNIEQALDVMCTSFGLNFKNNLENNYTITKE